MQFVKLVFSGSFLHSSFIPGNRLRLTISTALSSMELSVEFAYASNNWMIKFFTAAVERKVIRMGLIMIIALVGLVELVILYSPQ